MLDQGFTQEDFVNRPIEEINSWPLTLSTLIALTEPSVSSDECPDLEGAAEWFGEIAYA